MRMIRIFHMRAGCRIKRWILCLFFLTAALPATGWTETGNRVFLDAQNRKVLIPDEPSRVAVVNEVDLDAMLALGLRPYGVTMGRGQNRPTRYLGNRTDGMEILGAFFRPNLEILVAGQPDLILAGGIPKPVLVKQLNTIAPTAITYNLGEDWKTAFSRLAVLFNARDQYAAFMEDYDRRVKKVRQQLEKTGVKTVSIVRWNPKGPAFMQNNAFASLVLKDLGLGRPLHQNEPGIGHSHILSLENLHLIDAQVIFLGTLAGKGEAVRELEQAMVSPAFQALDAVKTNQVYQVDGSLWTSLGGPLAAHLIIDAVEQHLLGIKTEEWNP